MMTKYKITGMDCPNCATMLEIDLENTGIKCRCSYSNSSLEVDGKHDFSTLTKIVKKSGCFISPN